MPEPETRTLVSVAVVTFQHAQTIERCLASVLRQSIHAEVEVLVRDDGSTDGTKSIVSEFIRLHAPHWIFIDEPVNQYEQRCPSSSVFALCKGDYIAMLEGDDFWSASENLEYQRNFLDAWPTASIVGALTRNHDPNNCSPGMDQTIQGVPGWRPRGEIIDCHASSMMIRKSVATKYLEVAEPRIAGDLVIGLVAATIGSSFVFPFIWSDRWKLPTGLTATRAIELQERALMVAYRHGLGADHRMSEKMRGHLIRIVWGKVLTSDRRFRTGARVLLELYRNGHKDWSTVVRFLLYPITRLFPVLQPTLHDRRFTRERERFREGLRAENFL